MGYRFVVIFEDVFMCTKRFVPAQLRVHFVHIECLRYICDLPSPIEAKHEDNATFKVAWGVHWLHCSSAAGMRSFHRPTEHDQLFRKSDLWVFEAKVWHEFLQLLYVLQVLSYQGTPMRRGAVEYSIPRAHPRRLRSFGPGK